MCDREVAVGQKRSGLEHFKVRDQQNKGQSRFSNPARQNRGTGESLANSSGGNGRDAESGVQAAKRKEELVGRSACIGR